jgi:class 3 adenylate cyclase
MFTDIVDSTGMTTRLGDLRAVEMVRAHDGMVRRALAEYRGREIKHTGDGIMAAFDDVAAAVACACAIQQAFAAFNRSSSERLQVRVGIHAGEPVEDSNDLFGATVQIAARICQNAAAESIVVSETVRGLLGDAVRLHAIEPQQLKGFAAPIGLHEVVWR